MIVLPNRRGIERPAWVFPWATAQADFAEGRFWRAAFDQRQFAPRSQGFFHDSGASNTADITTAPMKNGKLKVFGQGLIRVTDMGLWSEAGDTNYALHSRDLTQTAWTKSNCTATRDLPGADWRDTANRGTRLTATANNATCKQSITLASGTFIFGARVRRITGSGTVTMTMDDFSTEIDVTSSLASGWLLVAIPAQTVTNPTIGFKLATSGDEIGADFVQGVDRNFLPTPIITTTTTQTRTINRPAINTEGASTSANQGVEMIRSYYSDSACTIFVEYAGNGANGNGSATNLLGGTGAIRMSAGVCGEAFGFGEYTQGGTIATTANVAKSAGINNLNRAMGTADGNCRSCLNGGAVASGTATNRSNKFYYSHMVFGGNGDGTATINGRFTRFAIGNTKVSDAAMIEATRF